MTKLNYSPAFSPASYMFLRGCLLIDLRHKAYFWTANANQFALPKVPQFSCRKEDKLAALIWILREFVLEGQPSIVFTSTRHHVEFLYSILQAAGLSVACVYGAMDQVQAQPRKSENASFTIFLLWRYQMLWCRQHQSLPKRSCRRDLYSRFSAPTDWALNTKLESF